MKNKKGYSLIEILVVLTVFALMATLATQSVLLTIRSSRKAEASIKARENLENAVSVIERQIRSAKSVTGTSSTRVDFVDSLGVASYFECRNLGAATNGYIAWGAPATNLTGANIDLTTCTFLVDPSASGVPAAVSVSITGTEINTSGVEAGNASVQTKIFLRQ